nr:unnamed protein product [Callosobruchus analis]
MRRQEQVYKEVIQVVGEHEEVTYENLKSLELTERVILESLRLCPTMFSLTRYAKERTRIGTQRIIPAGCHMKIFVYDVHHQEKHWLNPRKFDPDRFLPENVSQRNRYSYLAFSAGPRNCLGECKRDILAKPDNLLRSWCCNLAMQPHRGYLATGSSAGLLEANSGGE